MSEPAAELARSLTLRERALQRIGYVIGELVSVPVMKLPGRFTT